MLDVTNDAKSTANVEADKAVASCPSGIDSDLSHDNSMFTIQAQTLKSDFSYKLPQSPGNEKNCEAT